MLNSPAQQHVLGRAGAGNTSVVPRVWGPNPTLKTAPHTPSRPRPQIDVVCSSAIHFQKSHLHEQYDEFIQQALELQQIQQVQHSPAATPGSVMRSLDAEANATLADPSRLCTMDGQSDPAATMQQLRNILLLHKPAVLRVLHDRPDILLDAVAMLHLLNTDLQAVQGNSSHIAFRPLVSEHHDQRNSTELLILRVRAKDSLHRHAPHKAHHQAPEPLGSMGLGGTPSAHAPSSSPSHAQPATSEAWQMAHALVERLTDVHGPGSMQLRCADPVKLGTVFKALRRARKLLRLAGDFDLLVYPKILTENESSKVCLDCCRIKAAVNRSP